MRPLRKGGPKAPAAPSGAAGVATLEGPEGAPPPPDGRSRRRYDPAWDDWKRPRRWPGVLLSCVIVLAFLGVVVWHYRPHAPKIKPPAVAPSSKNPPQPPYVPGLGQPGVAVTSFSGKVTRAAMPFHTNGNLLILHAQCTCSYSFAVTIANAVNTFVSLPVSYVGHYNGTVSLPLAPGPYKLSVASSGPWQVQLVQPPPTLAPISTPFSYFSVGESVLGPFSSPNQFLALKFLSFTNGTITVQVLDTHGSVITTPFSLRGVQESQGTFVGLPNPYYLQVTAAGFWSLDVRRTSAVSTPS